MGMSAQHMEGNEPWINDPAALARLAEELNQGRFEDPSTTVAKCEQLKESALAHAAEVQWAVIAYIEANCHYALSNLSNAVVLSAEACHILEASEEQAHFVRALNVLALCQNDLGNTFDAFNALGKAAAIAEKSRLSREAGLSHLNLGYLHSVHCYPTEALHH